MSSQEFQSGEYAKFYARFGDPTAELHEAYDSWLEDMSSRPNNKLVPFEFDLSKHPEQSIYVPKVDAKQAFPNIPDALYYLGFKAKLAKSLGAISASRLINQFNDQPASEEDRTPLPQRLSANQQEGKNTLVITSHINFQELGYFKGLKHVAKKERHDIHKSGTLLSKLMTRQQYNGKRLVDHFTGVGNIYFSSPKSLSAEQHGVPDKAATLTNALFKKVLKPDLAAGGLEIDAALTGSAVKPVYDERGRLSYYEIPMVQPSSAKLLESFDHALGATLVGPPLNDKWQMEVSELYDLNELHKSNDSAAVTDLIYKGIADSLERFTRQEVVYNKIAGRLGQTATAGFSKS
jgi:hypothetical protein